MVRCMSVNDSLFIRALKRLEVERTPVWMMRQAGRYLPEYRKLRAKAGDFMSLCKNPELACEVTLQPLRRFSIDAAILFSDILTIPDAMGLGLYFEQGEGPRFEHPIKCADDIDRLPILEPFESLDYVMQAVSLIRQQLPCDTPLIGFAGSPWTLACYMVEGGSSKTFRKTKQLMYCQPQLMHQLLDKLALSTIAYLNGQIESGANAIMLFDTWGGILTTRDYKCFSLSYMQKIIDNLNLRQGQIPTIIFTKGGGLWLEEIAMTGVDGIGLDWTIDIAMAKKRVGDKVALQGNMDPAILTTNPQRIEQEVKLILSSVTGKTGHIFNLGHGITPDVPVDNVMAFFDAVQEFGVK
jgi:uroporphyrinogen decarboxylase